MTDPLWWAFWFWIGVIVAYLYAFTFITYALLRKRGHDGLATALEVATVAGCAWLIGYAMVGPAWATLATPAVCAGAFAGMSVCAYIREQGARVRVWRREVGK